MGTYDFKNIEKKWQSFWKDQKTFSVEKNSTKQKFYVLDMFPYPSGSGLHVGHPLGYIASDIVSRYQWLKGKNVLHPMGFDAFGLPAEQYAIDTGTPPDITTDQNITRYKEQLSILGMAYDPDTDIRTCDPSYYKWTQWIFLKLFGSWYNKEIKKAEPIEKLISAFEENGNQNVNAHTTHEGDFTAEDWKGWNEEEKALVLLDYRLVYTTTSSVNWCPALGTVLANDEVINGRSERGGHPVIQKPMRQWVMRMTAYADRLLNGLDTIDWPEPVKEMQRNWIGKSKGAEVLFQVEGKEESLEVFTTRPDTLFGSTFLVIAPEHELLPSLIAADQKEEVEKYIEYASNRSELERISDSKNITGAFTGSYAIHPFNGKKIPIWTADYVLAGYGTGTIMAVPAHDSRDYAFAKQFEIEIIEVVEGGDISKEAYESKTGTLINSDFINGMTVKKGISSMIGAIMDKNIGVPRINFRLRDPNFSRQRYWGEPIPIKLKNGVPYPLDEKELPLILPEVESYLPGEGGESALSRNKSWVDLGDGWSRETHTLPGYAGSSWYFLRYLDPQNDGQFVANDKQDYWMNVDLYIGGSEHAVGHLLYSRYWNMVLHDLGYVSKPEPFQKLVNQGMIQGRSSILYRLEESKTFVSKNLINGRKVSPIRIDVNLVENDILDIEGLKNWRKEYADHQFELEDGKYICGSEVEKMSKRYHNVVNPEIICDKYGADTFRMYEMFLGPLEQSKPWNTHGIEGVFKFLRKTWNLYYDDENTLAITEDEADKASLKILHQTIKKVGEDIERLSFNTTVSQFMILVNELTKLKCSSKSVLEPLLILLAPFAPHFSEEIWNQMGNNTSISKAEWPVFKKEYLVESSFEYPIQFNGKVKAKVNVALGLNKAEIEEAILRDEEVQKQLQNKVLKKVIVVPGRIVNMVV